MTITKKQKQEYAVKYGDNEKDTGETEGKRI